MPCPRPLRARLRMPQTQRRPRQRGSPQKTGVTQKGAKRERHLRFLEGKGVGPLCSLLRHTGFWRGRASA
eukprot:6232124-Ditylum_brightwellii.AAC.1